MSERTIHFGIVVSSSTTQKVYKMIDLPDFVECAGDSFIEWNEPPKRGDLTLHLTREIPDYLDPKDEDYVVGNYYIVLDTSLIGDTIRVADYCVTTDREDWSKNQRIYMFGTNPQKIGEWS